MSIEPDGSNGKATEHRILSDPNKAYPMDMAMPQFPRGLEISQPTLRKWPRSRWQLHWIPISLYAALRRLFRRDSPDEVEDIRADSVRIGNEDSRKGVFLV